MPEPALHFSVIFAVSAPRLGVKRALLLSLMALLPDLDVLIHIHRSMSHSIILLILTWIPILLVSYLFKHRHFNTALLCLLAVLSHPILDSFQTYTPILYPAYDRSIWVSVNGWLLISPEGFTPQATVNVKDTPIAFKPFESFDAPIFTSEGFLISLILTAAPILLGGIRKPSSRSKPSSLENKCFPGGFKPASEEWDPAPTDMVTVVIPTLNEEEAIGKVLDELLAEGYRNILVVDGYSTDKTVDVAKSRGVNVIYQNGFGKAGAITTAIEKVSTPYMLVMDGDYTYDPRDIKHLLKYAEEYDEVIGYRVNRGNIPLLHRFGNRIISLAFSLMLGKRVKDPCSGMYLLKTDLAKRLELTSSGFEVEVEIAGQIASLGKIAEAPISYRKRIGEKKLKAWRDGFKILTTAIKITWLYNPILTLSAPAALLTIPGATILLWQLTIRYLHGAEAWSLGWSWLGLLLFIAGLQGISIATISLTLKRMERRIIQIIKEKQK
jgi:dolichol-phosphate mannosyltransferase